MVVLIWLKKKYRLIYNKIVSIVSYISPRFNTMIRYRDHFGVFPNLSEPKTFNEKLLWLKLNNYNKNPLVIKCADKYRVREYIHDMGLSYILNEIYGVYDNTEQIPWDSLPNQFVLKLNFGAGMNIVCSDKGKLDIAKTNFILEKWLRSKPWLAYSEFQYKNEKPKIICEKFLSDNVNEVIPDYKVYCFHGKPQAILVMHDRGYGVKTEFYDVEWNCLENTMKYRTPKNKTEVPSCLQEMLKVSEILSNPFPFVRCDFYVVDSKLFFGEMTFTPAGGIYTAETNIKGKKMTEYLNVK